MQSISPWWMWLGFFIFLLCMLSIDIYLLTRHESRRVSAKHALTWVTIWVSLALLFNLLLWLYLMHTAGAAIANEKALAFLTGYLIEQSLSIDNMFVFLMIFTYFTVPPEYQRRVLLIGVLSAIAMRLVMILAGIWLISKFYWILYVFGLFLVITGGRMLLFAQHEPDLSKNPLLRWIGTHLRVTPNFCGEKFFVRHKKLLYVTPLFLVLVMIEASDLIFSVDSIPAIFAITLDPFIVFTSNIFAILGLRSLYFLLAKMADRFRLLKYGLSIILIFVGIKMLIAHWLEIPILLALGIVALILITCVLLNLILDRKKIQHLT